jgi:hypothetical protein
MSEQPAELTVEQEFDLIRFTQMVNAITDLSQAKEILVGMHRLTLLRESFYKKTFKEQFDRELAEFRELQ